MVMVFVGWGFMRMADDQIVEPIYAHCAMVFLADVDVKPFSWGLDPPFCISPAR